jgi:hypothetical protein
MANLSKFGEIEDAGRCCDHQPGLDTTGVSIMSEQIVSKFDREAFISKVDQLPPKVRAGYVAFVEHLLVLTPQEFADLSAYMDGLSYESDWGALLAAVMFAELEPDDRAFWMQKTGIRPGAPFGAKGGTE